MDTKIPAADIPLPLAEKLDRPAARVGPRSDAIVADALSAWLEREDRSEAMTLEALEDVDAGRLVDHQTVKEWAGSRLAETLPTAE
jgi:predicted transcriptional regulator